MKYEVGARVQATQAWVDWVAENEPNEAGKFGVGTKGTIIDFGDECDYIVHWDFEVDGPNGWGVDAEDIESTEPPSKQDALNRLLAEHKERKAALEETVKAIQALVERGTTLRHRKTGVVYHTFKGVRPTLFVETIEEKTRRFDTVSLKSCDIVDDASGGDTP